MKSSYELAMERLKTQAPIVPLTDNQKSQIAEIDSLYRSKVAEREVFLQDQIAKANAMEKPALQDQLAREVRRLNAECDEKKDKVRGVDA